MENTEKIDWDGIEKELRKKTNRKRKAKRQAASNKPQASSVKLQA